MTNLFGMLHTTIEKRKGKRIKLYMLAKVAKIQGCKITKSFYNTVCNISQKADNIGCKNSFSS